LKAKSRISWPSRSRGYGKCSRRHVDPDELARREERLRKIAEARAKIEARPGSVTRVSWPSMKPNSRRARPRPRRRARSLAASRRSRQPRTAAERSDQSHRRRVAHHAGGRAALSSATMRRPRGGGSMLVVAVDVVQAPTTSSRSSRCWTSSNPCPQNWARPKHCWRHGLFQRGECRGMREGRDRPADRHGASAASSTVARTLRGAAAGAGKSDAGRSDGASAEDAGRPRSIRPTQTDPEPVFASSNRCSDSVNFDARTRKSTWRVEPCDHGLEYETDVRPQPAEEAICSFAQPKVAWCKVIRRSHNPFWTPSSVR